MNENSEPQVLMQLYHDGKRFFFALPDFENLQDSPVIHVTKLTLAELFRDNAQNQSVEQVFWQAVDGEIVWK